MKNHGIGIVCLDFATLERDLRDALAVARKWEESWGDINPSPILSATMAECMQRDPAKYRNLQVRLCGWNVRFVDLDRAHQDWIIREAEGSGA